ncbi:isoprenoid biosynthesis glyoxalase ElbB [Mangrovibacterium marinum]|uniref:Enhancing lycopene biosynthesis protein 2 n=1 Tax=Mangrovibacterium marinum TaxID=1639118 RepID=A0A2T5BY54_9BACT|nr:isoprenoid biosynthesis glyoxalase ElbB [Mangrovibacterium marinum]PTN06761.1 enhancing lycopene biosynthesis protein 2 [Mangrovibacterium marinum]
MTNQKKIAVVLSGCGVYDGAEIHEATLTMLAIAKQGASYTLFAPNTTQHHVINHLTGQEMPETRNVLVESARIARGQISDLKDYNPANFDAIIFPGGFGAAKNLSTFAFDGPNCTVNEDVTKAVKATAKAGKPIGALCIAPAVITRILSNVDVTIGDDPQTAKAIEKMGGKHIRTTDGEIVIDRNYRVVTTPCYMLDTTIDQIEIGARNVVKTILTMCQ